MTHAQPPYLLTPGPITTTQTVKSAMLRDWGSWDADFRAMTDQLCQQLLTVANARETHVCIPIQGSGTFAVEATLGTLIPQTGKVLVLMNGAYGQRIAKTLAYLKREHVVLDKGDYLPPMPDEVEALLQADPDITHVTLIHCETSSGILNPVSEIAEVVARQGRLLIIDSMSAFGAIPVDAQTLPFAALISSANKCFEGVPGFGFSLVRRDILIQCAGQAHSLSLDLYDQWQYLEKTGQWRFTPPTHVVAAFLQALAEHQAEGGVAGRLARYQRNQQRLVAGMKQMGFSTLLNEQWLSPIIVTFLSPQHPNFNFDDFYNRIKAHGFVIYPGKLTVVDSFRLGCIGQLYDQQIDQVLVAISAVLDEMQIESGYAELPEHNAVTA
ncbi:2-aminoethylphosphonate-pyruvate transaminase [Oceanospirillum multiglobuliferum]|uniref:2-aminoethylphosphonate--pyruvate transaminase n=1 Tax=Oceanospirillum multiglobuliferum TaxID=64969 RepID=A0A1T4NDX2_9GAMM|nr:2-aminoethylphosphonate--pyruvate transaminase [Oceanospirillum multiglobuliferum]OPX55929.1 2-aminoethylphosphonate--pyruvate transaminase [Oceanospirillum multiglobuliferum]SJZ77315.1 2-aminoethylphosphonate-pyruvate transaminase [Oceanospirillum multiglobuliferum]